LLRYTQLPKGRLVEFGKGSDLAKSEGPHKETLVWLKKKKKKKPILHFKNQTEAELGVVAHPCNPSTWEAETAAQGAHEFKTILGYLARPYRKTKQNQQTETIITTR
jgi:hypothetical protein